MITLIPLVSEAPQERYLDFESKFGLNFQFRVGIVSTVRNPGPSFDSWLCYHLSIGFSRIYLFFDDPTDPDIATARKYPKDKVLCVNQPN